MPDESSPKITWDDDPFASLAAVSPPRRKLSNQDESFIEQTLRMITENPSYKGILVMHDEQTNRMRYIVFNDGTMLGGMASMGRVFARLAELAAAEAASE